MRMRNWMIAVSVVLLAAVPALAEKQSPPRGGQPKDFRLPEKTRFSLDNGLSVTLVPYGTLPKATISLRVRSGNLNETAEQTWLADLTGDLLAEGAGSRNAEQLAAAFAEMGGELEIDTGVEVTSISTDVLSEFGPEAVRVLAEVVRRPALPESELERLKNDRVRQLSISMSRPQSKANEKFAQLLYGDHPYGRLYPTEEMVRGYGIDDVRGFFETNFGARRTHVYVVGKFDDKAIERAIRESFDDWSAGPEPLIHAPEMKSERAVHLIARPGAPQSTLRIGLPVVDPSSDDYMALLVTNTLLGGSFGSRITSNIREDKGFTYSPRSSVSTRYRAAHWVQSADVTTEATGPSLKEIFFEIDRLQQEPPTQEELEGIQNYLAGVFVLQNSSRGGIVNRLAFLDLHGLDDDFLTGYVRRILAVTPQEVTRITKDYLRDEEMTIVVVGDPTKIEAQLQPYE